MSRFEQFEVWALNGQSWEPVASFPDFSIAKALLRNRTSGARLMHVVYQDGQPVEQDVLARVGATREEP